MTRWTVTRNAALGALLLGSLSVGGATTAAGPQDVAMCTDGGPRPCVVSVLRNGAPIDESWHFTASYWAGIGDSASSTVSFYAVRTGGEFTDLGFDSLGDTWSVTLDVGSVVPRGVAGHAQDAHVEKAGSLVTVTGRPVTISGQCDPDNNCPEWADLPDESENGQWDGAFDFQILDFAGWEDAPSLAAVNGIELFSNIATTSIPPSIRHDEATGSDYLWIEMANRHYFEDGTTVVQGQLDLRIPNEFLRTAYGVPNPELMTTEGLDPEVTGKAAGSGTIEVIQDQGGDAMQVHISGVTFSHRIAKIRRGVIVPTRPVNVVTQRSSATRGKVAFGAAHARGAKVRGYDVRCRSGSAPVVTAHGRSPVTVTGLARGMTYRCDVRATSKAGPGPWSRSAVL